MSSPDFTPLFALAGAASAIVFCVAGSAYGTAKSAMGISELARTKPNLIMKSLIPVVMSGVLSIYGIILSIIISTNVYNGMPLSQSLGSLTGGLVAGLSCLASGVAIGTIANSATRAVAEEPKFFVGMILILIFAEALEQTLQMSSPDFTPLFALAGAASAIVFCVAGSAYGTAKSAMGISELARTKPNLIMKSLIPVVMSGVLSIYGIILSIIISTNVYNGMPLSQSLGSLTGGLVAGLSCLASGVAIGTIANSATRAVAEEPKFYVGMILILIFAEALGLYGFVIGLVMSVR